MCVLMIEHRNDNTRSFGCCFAAFQVCGIWNLMKLSMMTFRVKSWLMMIDLSFPSQDLHRVRNALQFSYELLYLSIDVETISSKSDVSI